MLLKVLVKTLSLDGWKATGDYISSLLSCTILDKITPSAIYAKYFYNIVWVIYIYISKNTLDTIKILILHLHISQRDFNITKL